MTARVFIRTSHGVVLLGATHSLTHMFAGERFNTCTHLLGLALAILGVPFVLAKTLPSGDPEKIGGGLVFALCCVVLYAASTLFHGTQGRAKAGWQRADHCAIYVLIAGSYTPFALVSVQGALGWALAAAVWCVALLGVWREIRSTSSKPPLGFYIGLGWVAVAAAAPLLSHMATAELRWLLAGAVSYTAGTVFYVNRAGYQHAHGIWHLFVLGGTASHYMAVLGLVA